MNSTANIKSGHFYECVNDTTTARNEIGDEEVARAQKTVCHWAKDATEADMMMRMLGIHPRRTNEDGQAVPEVQTYRVSDNPEQW